MICPVCKSVIKLLELSKNLLGYVCFKCDSKFIRQDDYYRWNKGNNEREVKIENKLNFLNKSGFDFSKIKNCPECYSLLIKYNISKNIDFKIERCGKCGGMWFDSNKWDILSKNNLHFDLYKIFTEFWQRKIRQLQKKESLKKVYIKKFGEEDYKILNDLKKWIDSKDNKSDIINFLIKF